MDGAEGGDAAQDPRLAGDVDRLQREVEDVVLRGAGGEAVHGARAGPGGTEDPRAGRGGRGSRAR